MTTPIANAAPRGLLLCAITSALFLAASSASAEVPDELYGLRVVDLRIEGATSGFMEAGDLEVPEGATLDRALVRALVTRLTRDGRFADVQVDAVALPEGARLVVYLEPRLLIERIDISGDSVLDEDDLLRAMEVERDGEISVDRLPELERRLSEAYDAVGYLDARATVGMRDTDDPFRKVLIIRIDERSPTRIAGMRLPAGPAQRRGVVREALDLDEGDVFDVRAVAEAVRAAEIALRSEGFLEARLEPPTATPTQEGVVITVGGAVGPRYVVDIVGNEPVRREEIESALGLEAERLSGPAVLLSIRARVVDLYRKYGFQDATATVTRLEAERPGTAILRVRVTPGERLDIVGITFPGARALEVELLREQIFSYLEEDLPSAGLLRPVDSETANDLGFSGGTGGRARDIPAPLDVDPQRVFYAPTYEEAIDHIRELYQADGYLSARVGPARLQMVGAHRAAVVIPIDEGPRTRLERVTLSGNQALRDPEILALSRLEIRGPFSHLALEETRLRIVDLYRDRGYLFVRVEPVVQFSDDRLWAGVRLDIVEGFEVRVGEIEIRGAERTSRAMILDRLTLREGDLYRPRAARESEEQLTELGIFAGVTITPEEENLPARVKRLIVTVAERPGQSLDAGGGISTGEGVRGGFEYNYRNLFGYAVGLTLGLQLGYQFFFVDPEVEDRFTELALIERIERRATLGINIPHTGVRNLGASIDLAHVRDNERDFGLDKYGASLTLTYRPMRELTFSVSEDLENNTVDFFADERLDEYLENITDQRLIRLLRVPDGESTLVATRFTVSLDLRDSPFVKTRGVYASLTSEWARTLQTEQRASDVLQEPFFSNFLKLSLNLSGYLPLGRGIVLAGQVRAGRVIHFEERSATYPNRLFFLGGVDTMRGFLDDSLVPQDVADRIAADPNLDVNTVSRGGDAFILWRVELRVPIVGDFHGGLFADLGNVWADADNFAPFDVRPTIGCGLRYQTPIGPFAVDFGFPVTRRRALGERLANFHLSIGLF